MRGDEGKAVVSGEAEGRWMIRGKGGTFGHCCAGEPMGTPTPTWGLGTTKEMRFKIGYYMIIFYMIDIITLFV